MNLILAVAWYFVSSIIWYLLLSDQPAAYHNRDGANYTSTGTILMPEGAFTVPDNNAFGHSFRDFEKENLRKAMEKDFYKKNHIHQTYEFKVEYGKLNKAMMSIWECCELLNQYVDESDPDLDKPQIEHLLQSAEAIRKDYANEDRLHLTASFHDLGKVLLHPTFGGEPQWCVVGDTFPIGCTFSEIIVHYKFFKENPDYKNPNFNTKLGIYTENCGLDNVTISWDHDEYMYLIPFFLCTSYRWRYGYLMNDEDKEMLKWLHVFNKYDLYSNSKVKINLEELKPYYLSLIEKNLLSSSAQLVKDKSSSGEG